MIDPQVRSHLVVLCVTRGLRLLQITDVMKEYTLERDVMSVNNVDRSLYRYVSGHKTHIML